MSTHTLDRYLGPEQLPNGAYAHIYLLRCGNRVRLGQGSLEPSVCVNAGAGEGICPACRQANIQFAATMRQQAPAQKVNVSPGGIAKGNVGGYDTGTKSIDSDLGALESDGDELGVENDPYPETSV